jgi:hypothetical protein
MTKLLEKAFQNVSNLSEIEQDQLGQRLLTWYEMRSAIDAARAQAENGEFSNLDADTIIAQARATYVGK